MRLIEIPLTHGKVALVDDEDIGLVSRHKWYARKGAAGTFYAVTNVRTDSGKRTGLAMHRLILSATPGLEVDHVNSNGLDNRRSNLRLCTHVQNTRNRRLTKRSYHGYKGVSRLGRSPGFMSRVNREYIGVFDTAEEAARAYDRRAIELFGEFARTNFPRTDYEQAASNT